MVLDLHSYNHRRAGPDRPPADPAGNPCVNVGTDDVDEDRWGPLIEKLVGELRRQEIDGIPLDAREDVKFRGAHLVQWVNSTFPASGCGLAIEVKKFFMDEHAGRLDLETWKDVHRALEAAVPGIRRELRG